MVCVIKLVTDEFRFLGLYWGSIPLCAVACDCLSKLLFALLACVYLSGRFLTLQQEGQLPCTEWDLPAPCSRSNSDYIYIYIL